MFYVVAAVLISSYLKEIGFFGPEGSRYVPYQGRRRLPLAVLPPLAESSHSILRP